MMKPIVRVCECAHLLEVETLEDRLRGNHRNARFTSLVGPTYIQERKSHIRVCVCIGLGKPDFRFGKLDDRTEAQCIMGDPVLEF
jgi:hypothetical protein